jgi:predicted N-acetyltransferase YhbS
MNIERATKQDFNELMDLLVRHSRIHTPTHPRLEEMFPDLYQPTDESMNCHFIMRQDGRIVAVVGVYPFKVRIANVHLGVVGVGAVCTTPEYQGKGLISALLQAARADI